MKKSRFLQVLAALCIAFSFSLKAQNATDLIGNSFDFTTKDSVFKSPYIDVDEWRETPVKHRYVHGGFQGTETRFSYYFPIKEIYNGRFFQYITPFPDNEFLSQGLTGEDDKLGFSLVNGAYFIETNGGGAIDFSKPALNNDATIGAFRANAASAEFSRVVALKIMGGSRPFGYAFGGSGGAYRTIGSIENTNKVWDGVVPYVLGSPMAIPNVFSVRMNAMRILDSKMPQIIDALDAGGSGDMYAGLNEEETIALQEAVKLGFPAESWFGYKTMGIHGFIALYQGMRMADSQFFKDFWTVNGYLGAIPTESLLKARIQIPSKIKANITAEQAVEYGLKEAETAGHRGSADLAWKSIGGVEGEMPVGFEIEDLLPDVNFMGGDLVIKTGSAAGSTLQLASIKDNKVVFGPADMSILAKIKVGDEVFVDNSNFLAVQTYHRHQVPGPEYKVWDQFRDADGKPLYPQRPFLLGPLFTQGAAGVLPTGKFEGKMILLCSLWDREAFAWQGDFYRDMVKKNLGDKADENFRLWYTDKALHGDLSAQEYPDRTVSYLGVLQQALLDLSDWVERGIVPAISTNYKIEDGQVIVPAAANARKGLQPTVVLKANGFKKAVVKPGQKVKYVAEVDVPQNTGEIVTVEWDFDGDGNIESIGKFKKGTKILAKAKHKFMEPGTYFSVIRIAAQRKGNENTPFTLIKNLDRVRVEVEL